MESEADQRLLLNPAVQPVKPRLITDPARQSGSQSTTGSAATGGSFSEDDLARALEESKKLVDQEDPSLRRAIQETQDQHEDDALQQALAMSMEG